MFNSNPVKLIISMPAGISGSHGALVVPNVAKDTEHEIESVIMKTCATDHPNKRLSAWQHGDAKTIQELQMLKSHLNSNHGHSGHNVVNRVVVENKLADVSVSDHDAKVN